MVKMRVTIKENGHKKMTGEIGTIVKGEDPATMTTKVLIVKYPQDTRTTTIKGMIAGTLGTTTMEERIQVVAKGSSQGGPGSIINHQMTC
jgi:hypothetical protein